MSNYGVPVHEISFDLNDVVMDAATTNDRILAAIWVSFLPRNAEMTRKALKLARETRVVALKTTFLLGGNPDPGTWDEETQALADECFDVCEKHDLMFHFHTSPGGNSDINNFIPLVEKYGKRCKIYLVHFGGGVSGHIKLVPKFLQWVQRRLQGLHRHLVGGRVRRALAADRDREAPASAATACSSAPTSRGRTSTASTGSSTASATSRRSSRTACSGRTTRRRFGDACLTSRPRRPQLLVELQSLGVRVGRATTPARCPGRRGGAGPSDALFLWVRGLPLTVPVARRVRRRARRTRCASDRAARATLYRDDELVGPVTLPRRPRIYDMETADGIPYWKIALLHLDSIASTVVQKCIYWGTHEQCGFCGIELTRGEQTIPVKTPAQLAEVCTAARDYDHAVDVTLTTGSLNRRDRGAIYISRCAAAIKEACGLPIQVQFEPPDDLRVLEEVQRAGVDAVGIHVETFDPEVLARVAPGKAQCGVEGYFRMLGAGGRGVRARQRDDVRAPRDGRAAGADRGGLPARDRDGRLPVRRPAAAGARAR